ncbi:MAG: SprT-like domain-containing protein, partial [Microbacterium gubbeenense]
MADLTRVTVWANALIRMHLDPSWTFAFDNAKRRAGLCNFTAQRISVSKYLAARFSDDDVHQTLLH